MVASGADYTDSTAKIWDAADGTLLHTFPGHSWGVVSVDFSPDGQLLAVGYIKGDYVPGGLVDVWDIANETVLQRFGGAHVAFSADGELLASGGGGANRYAYVHRVSDGYELAQIYSGSYIGALALSPDGQIVATGGSDNLIKLWDAYTGAPIRNLVGHSDDISALAFSPDGEILASGAGGFDEPGDSTIKLWQVSDGTLLRTLDGHDQWVYALSYAPNGAHLLSSGRDGSSPNSYTTIRIWQVADGALLQTYDQGTQYGVPSVEFSPNGDRFAYGRGRGYVAVARNPLYECPGDLDDDGVVGQADLGILLASFGVDEGGDLDGDNDTDQADLGILLAHWGEGCG
jgi:WD40 repeat protein